MNTQENLRPTLTRNSGDLADLFSSLSTVSDVAHLLEVPHWLLVYVLYRSEERRKYRTFSIPKKSGGVREISAPRPSLAILQSKLNSVLQVVYPGKPSAHGFIRGRSILSNARSHAGKKCVLNVDLEDFFPSINFGRVRGMFMARPYNLDPRAATVLAQLCCYENHIPQGAPSSPIISNMICGKLDSDLQSIARQYRCTYSRYADDLTFSTTLSRFPEELATCEDGWTADHVALGEQLLSVITSNGFRINQKKVRLQIRGCHQEVTGLTVNEFPNVRRRYVRQVRAMLHAWKKYGEENAEREFREKYDTRSLSRNPDAKPPSFRQVVRGKLNFLRMVRGESDPVFRKLANKLNSLAPELIERVPDPPPDDPNERWAYWERLYRDLIFHVEVRKDGGVSSGTAFTWRRGALATAAHNLAGEVRVGPPFVENQPLPASSFLFHPSGGQEIDVAVLTPGGTAGASGAEIPVRRDPINPGEQVAVLGYASVPLREPGLGMCLGVVESKLSSYGRRVETIQVSNEISGGMSGSPAIDRWGQLFGVAMETTFEQTDEGVPARAFRHILPIRYLLEIEF